ncbi:hypothetical protein ACWOA7_07525 [Gemella morbillorum]
MGNNYQSEETLVNLKFEKLDQIIKEYNSFGKDVCVEKQCCYFEECVHYVSQLEQEGVIIKTKGKEYNISYLMDIMVNDGPEYALVIGFFNPYDETTSYEMGVCVRGRPLLKKRYKSRFHWLASKLKEYKNSK